MEVDLLKEKAKWLRKYIMEVGYKTQSGHLSSALSIVEVMTVLYYGQILSINNENYMDYLRNRFIMSKGHACIIQYIILADLGILPKEYLDTFCKPKGILGAHPDCLIIPGVDASTGSLGHGLSFGAGTAMAAKYNNYDFMTYVLLGDGECQEGSIWEAALCIGNKNLDNLVIIIDCNKLQATDYVDNISSLGKLADKWNAFGFDCFEIDGNDIEQVYTILSDVLKQKNGRSKVIIAHTVKGKGVSLIENKSDWHGRKPDTKEWMSISRELGIEKE